jgi:hypothetical protein
MWCGLLNLKRSPLTARKFPRVYTSTRQSLAKEGCHPLVQTHRFGTHSCAQACQAKILNVSAPIMTPLYRTNISCPSARLNRDLIKTLIWSFASKQCSVAILLPREIHHSNKIFQNTIYSLIRVSLMHAWLARQSRITISWSPIQVRTDTHIRSHEANGSSR